MVISTTSTSLARTADRRAGAEVSGVVSLIIACGMASPVAALQPFDGDDERKRQCQQDNRHGAGGTLVMRFDLAEDVDRRGQRAARDVTGDDHHRAEFAERAPKT